MCWCASTLGETHLAHRAGHDRDTGLERASACVTLSAGGTIAAMDRKHIRCATRDAVAVITLDRHEARNAYSDEMIDGLIATFDELEADAATKCVVLTGAGTAFSAGGDLEAMKDRTGMFAGNPVELRTRYVRGIQKIPRRIAAFEKPLIAAINGPAIGAGLDLACMCDIRVASESARFGSTFVRVGLVPGDGGAYFLARVVGFPRALDMILSARIIDATRALEIGLVHDLVAPPGLMDAAMDRAREIAENAPWAVRMAKRACYRSQGADLETALELASSYQGLVQHTRDHEEAVHAILDRRPPSFTGE